MSTSNSIPSILNPIPIIQTILSRHPDLDWTAAYGQLDKDPAKCRRAIDALRYNLPGLRQLFTAKEALAILWIIYDRYQHGDWAMYCNYVVRLCSYWLTNTDEGEEMDPSIDALRAATRKSDNQLEKDWADNFFIISVCYILACNDNPPNEAIAYFGDH